MLFQLTRSPGQSHDVHVAQNLRATRQHLRVAMVDNPFG